MQTVSNEIEPIFLYVYGTVARVAAEQGIRFIVVGASARDLVMHHVHGAPIQRASNDIDFGLLVEDWGAFDTLRSALLSNGFSETDVAHRLLSPDEVRTDLIPFGPICDVNTEIEWPDDDGVRMNVLGFQEACDHSDIVRVQTDPIIDVSVATPAGMMLLKLIAWTDRAPDLRTRDATDLRYLLANYDRIPSVLEAIYNDPEIGTRYDWDTSRMSADLLGQHSASIASPETVQAIKSRIIENASTGARQRCVSARPLKCHGRNLHEPSYPQEGN